MSEYWKSTPSYWCKFCSQYVRDTNIERKNHEATAKHQNNIQRSLRELHKTQEREKREKQQAKDEVARLNGMFSGKAGQPNPTSSAAPVARASQPFPTPANAAAQRRAHAEQLAALGVELPEELKKEVTGVGTYHVVSERAVDHGAVIVNRSLADILTETRRQGSEGQNDIESEDETEAVPEATRKRKAEDEDIFDDESVPKRKAWGSSLKTYPGLKDLHDDAGDLDTLLCGIKKKELAVKLENSEDADIVKREEAEEPSKSLDIVPDVNALAATDAKQESSSNSAPAVVFKKRKSKK